MRPEKESVRDFTANSQRLVVPYSLKRATGDRKLREQMMDNLKKTNSKASQGEHQDESAQALTLGNSGYQWFLKIEGEYEVKLDEE